jgi:hypothetical protein
VDPGEEGPDVDGDDGVAETGRFGATPGGGLLPALWFREKDQPSKPPLIASRFFGPALLYDQAPPLRAYQ